MAVVPPKDSVIACFQPVIDSFRLAVAGHEVLGRERLESGELKSLGPLFGGCEDGEALRQLDRHIRYQALQQFLAAGQPGYLAINVTPAWMLDFKKDDPIPTIEMVRELGVDPRKIVVEFVESAGENANMQYLIQRYREVGMRIAIDDFGSGQSHIDRLLALEPDIIKLDMDLFQRAARGGLPAKVVLGISDIARRSGSTLLCEGVETEEALQFALDCGARYLQGFFFSQAAPTLASNDLAENCLKDVLPRYLNSKKAHYQSRQKYNDILLAYFQQLQTLLSKSESHSGINHNISPELLPEPPAGFIRFFICADNGNQISPNFEFTPAQGWQSNPENLGCNWASRPYFYSLLAGCDRGPITSTPYHDVDSAVSCVTFGCRLDESRLLFMDKVLWES
ncbi:EAL domain-containing protein [Spongiibacter sp. KMU-158]|uniref:EAL domain-containing protein n=1 Tax=Spongiibacter pelagi TaxID=2760804 RepID=A0A927GVR9_9GAMM|nr:EAL domain-containing protein [Spongiibacter pelagi]MBD2858182.1 EAL domain-containing protein [Spongiibacter pelagi]